MKDRQNSSQSDDQPESALDAREQAHLGRKIRELYQARAEDSIPQAMVRLLEDLELREYEATRHRR